MQKSKPMNRNLKKHASIQRDAIEDIKEAKPVYSTYSHPNRDRSVGTADRTGRHFDEERSETE